MPLPAAAFMPGLGRPTPHLPSALPPHCGYDPETLWRRLFCHGIDLFNQGFWWEAHEAWEAPWRALPRGSSAARVLRGLIMLSAGHLNWCQGQMRGRSRLFEHAHSQWEAAAGLEDPLPHWLALSAPALQRRYGPWCRQVPRQSNREELLRHMPPLHLEAERP